MARYSLYVQKVPLNTKQTNKHVLVAMYEPLSKGIKDVKCRRLWLSFSSYWSVM